MPTLNNQEMGIDTYSAIKGVKESDILLLSSEDLLSSHGGRRVNDIKKVLTPAWLKSNLMKPGVFFAYVEERTKKGTIFLEVKIDRAKKLGVT